MPNDLKLKKNRIIVLCFLFATYFFATAVDFSIKRTFFENNALERKSSILTMEHFSQPGGNIFIHSSQLKEFLKNVVSEKEGLLSYKLFYIGLLILYLLAALSVFRKLFP